MIKVKIAKAIANKGAGFFDLTGGQTILPPDKNGKPDADHVFAVNDTLFVREKLKTGELILAEKLAKDVKPSDTKSIKEKG